MQTAYDAVGRSVQLKDAKGMITSFTYDDLGRLIQVTDANGGTVNYAYDKVSNRTAMTDPNGNTTTYTYDALNRLVKKTEPLGVYQYAYDAVGNRISMTDPNKNTINYTYDELNRLIKITYPDDSAVSFSYDANSNRLKMIDSLGMTNYQYDALNRLTGYTDPFGKAVGYGYDANGNRTTLTYPDGKTVNYTYDTLNRLVSVKDWLNKTTTYSYDTVGRLSGIANANNTAVAYTYDDAGRFTGLKNSKSDATVISSYAFTLDAVGNHSQSVQNEPLSPNIANQNITYVYDTENRLTSAGGAAVTHDANGNMTGKGSDTFAHDYNDRLMQSNIAGVVSQYSYDGLGNRLAKTEGGKTTRYVLDVNGSLSKILAETDGSGNITAYYVHGIGLMSKVLPDETAYYYHYDSRGSTIALTDSAQTITDAYAYDPFGKVANSTGSTSNPFKYVGRYGVMDEGNGLSYIRARYYASELGRFITKDLKAGNDKDGQSLHRYIYALNNPVRLVDVSGFTAKEVKGTTSNNNGSSDPIFLHNKLLNSNAVFITAPQLSEEEQYKSAMQVKGMEKFSSFIQRGLVEIVAEGGKRIGNRLFPGMGAAFKVGVKMVAEDIQLERKLEPITNWIVGNQLKDKKGRQFLIKVGEGKYIIFEVEEFLHQIDEQLKD